MFLAKFRFRLAAALALFLAMAPLAQAQTPQTPDREAKAVQTIGWGRFFNNDYIGDGHDRWHSSSYTLSRLRGPEWTGQLPERFGQVLELRLRAEQVTPQSLSAPSATDRRYAGILSLGYHSHFAQRGQDIALGADVVFIGPQTGLSRFQDFIHDNIGLPDGAPSFEAQFPDAVHLSGAGEVGRPIALAPRVTLRPFVEGRIGFETYVRAGADVTIGRLGEGGLLLRDVTTGQRYSAVRGALASGVSLTFGADVARVFSSALLPEGGAAQASAQRARWRTGISWQGKKSALFMGATYLYPEFDGQPEGQTIGSLSLFLKF